MSNLFSRLRPYWASAILPAAFLVAYGYSGSGEAFGGEGTGTLIVTTGTGGQEGHTFKVYVNEEYVGSVGKRDSQKLSFSIGNTGNNSVYIRDINEPEFLFGARTSSTLTFTAHRDARVLLKFDYMDGQTYVNGGLTVADAGTPPVVAPREVKMEILGVKLGDAVEEKEIANEVVETPAGIVQEYEISRTIERSVSFTDSASLEGSAKVDLKLVGAEIKAKIERQEDQTFKQTETIRRSLKIDGSSTPKLKVVWVGTYRTGTARVSLDGIEKKIPFALQVGLKPILKTLKD